MDTTNRFIFLGAIDSNKWLNNGKDYSRNFHQGYRVYGSMGIANTISASSIGGLGGNSGLYLVVNERTNNS